MNEEDMTKEQLIQELVKLRKQIIESHAKKSLKESEENYRTLVEQSSQGILLIHDKRVIFTNKAFASISGYTVDELLKLSPDELKKTVHPDDQALVWDHFRSLLAGKPVYPSYEGRIVRKDGTVRWLELYSNSIKFHEKPVVQVIITDITKRKKLESQLKDYTENLEKIVEERTNALKLSEERLQAILTGIGALITIQNKDLDIIWANKPMQDIYGEIIGKKCYRVYRGLEEKCPSCTVERVLNEEGIVVTQRTNILPDGGIMQILTTSSPIRDAKGNITAVVEVVKDITERMKLENALKESEERLQAILTGIGDLITIQNEDLDIIWANKPMQDIYGEIIGKKCYRVYKRLEDKCPDCIVERVFNDGKTIARERPFILPDGRTMQILSTSSPIRDAKGHIIAVVGVLKDITERKKLENALKESEERYRGLYDSSIDGIASVNREGQIIECNQAFADIHGYTKEELYKMSILDLIQGKSFDEKTRNRIEQLLTRGYSDVEEIEHVKKDGTTVPVSTRTWIIKDNEGNPIGGWGIVSDITKRKQLEQKLKEHTENLEKLVEQQTVELKESEARYRGLYDSSIDGIVSFDVDEKLIECNKAFADMLGYSKAELQQLNSWEFVHPDWHDKVRTVTKHLIQGDNLDEYELVGIKKDGTLVSASLRSWLIKDKDDNPLGTWCVVRDITERKRAEEELLKVQKLESLGILAGGIAHDFNNILTAILTNVSLAKAYSSYGDKVFNRLTDAEKASTRAKDLTQQLLTFSKGGMPIKKTISISNLISDMVTFALSGSSVQYEFSLPEDLWSVEVDEGQISQVINNLVINADQAMPEGGIIKISAENITIGPDDGLPLQAGNFVKLTIKDQGVGIPQENLSKVFDPYFTTKEKGSGLGLAIVYSIIKNHGGHITIDSKVDIGSTFSIYLLASQKPILMKSEVKEKPIIGKGKILVMDDDEGVREALDEILTYLGYQTEFARNGEEAIVQYMQAKSLNQPFEAVILDLTVRGGIGGKETIKKLIEIEPKVKAIVSSGYSTDPVMADFKKYGFSGVVVKPFNVKELSEALHQAINGRD